MHRRQVLTGLAAAPLLAMARAVFAADTNDAEAVVGALARETRARYHDGALGGAIADRLLAALRAGRFAPAATPDAVAELVNAEIQAASHDMHFMVMAGVMAMPVPPTPPHSEPPPFNPAELAILRRANFGIAAAEILPGNIGRLDLRQFYRPAAEIRDRLGAAMATLAPSAGLIVDLSRNIGGDPNSVALLLSYFFDRAPLLVNRFHWRNLPVEEFRTTADPGGPRYGESRPLIVLVSDSTFSAAEEFAYDVQALRRGTIVGAVTGGGANHALPVTIAGAFTAFIPEARAENPITGTNWERVGVRPDLMVGPVDLARAGHRLALERVIAAGDAEDVRVARQALSSP